MSIERRVMNHESLEMNGIDQPEVLATAAWTLAYASGL